MVVQWHLQKCGNNLLACCEYLGFQVLTMLDNSGATLELDLVIDDSLAKQSKSTFEYSLKLSLSGHGENYTADFNIEYDPARDISFAFLKIQNHFENVRLWSTEIPHLYELCDKYGLYVIAEADLECHGFELTNRPDRTSDDVTWSASYVERAMRLVHPLKNHPSILHVVIGQWSPVH